MNKKHATHEPEFSHVPTTVHLGSVNTPFGRLWAGEEPPGQVASSSLIYKYELASLRLFLASNTGVFWRHQFILSCPDSITAARGTCAWPSWVWSDSGKVQGTGSPGKWSDWVCSSIWLSSCCLPRQLPAEERFCSYQRHLTCLESSCHRVSSQSGPREHLSPSLNWLQHLIKALLRDEGDKNDAPSLRRRLKENVLSANYIYSLFGHPNLLHIPNWASAFEHYCYILSTFQPVVHRLSSLFTAPYVSKHCQPDSTVTGG